MAGTLGIAFEIAGRVFSIAVLGCAILLGKGSPLLFLWGLWIEEGLALGLKVAASDIPVFRERDQPNVTFGPRTPEGMAEAILRAHQTPWQEQSAPVRTMIDFSVDLGHLIGEISDERGS